MSSKSVSTERISRRSAAALFAGAAVSIALPSRAHAQASAVPPNLDVPYVPTPQEVVDKMLMMAQVREGDYLIDLGCGDGRIPVTAALRFNIRAYGVDIDPRRIEEAKASAQEKGVSDKATFEVKNLFDTKIADATVLTLYLLPRINLELRPRILSELKPGTRVVSHAFDMGDWKPDRSEQVNGRNVHMWTVPKRD
jgi:SAM-dependent methyltransferase